MGAELDSPNKVASSADDLFSSENSRIANLFWTVV